MKMSLVIPQFLNAHDYTESTLKWYVDRLNSFVAYMADKDIETLSANDVRGYITHIKQKYENSHTVHGFSTVAKILVTWCEREEYIDKTFSHRVALPKREQTIIRLLKQHHVELLLTAAKAEQPVWMGRRDHMVITLFLNTGIRASELTGLMVNDVCADKFSRYIVVYGKGRKERQVPLDPDTSARLHRWIHLQRPHQMSEYVFTSMKGTKLTVFGIDQVVKRLVEKAAITDIDIYPHLFRHTFASQYVLGGGSVYDLSRILGHTSVTVTETYLRGMEGYIPENKGIWKKADEKPLHSR